MTTNDSEMEQGRPGDRGWLRRMDQAAIAIILAISGCLMAASVLLLAWQRGGVINLETAKPAPIEFVVDLNTAAWPELALLPNVGEVLARRIVDSREQEGPFVDLDQLNRVEGIRAENTRRDQALSATFAAH